MAAEAGAAAGCGDLAADIEDDGTVELSLMASEHPEIKRFGHSVFQHAKVANELSRKCAPWCKSEDFPEAALEASAAIQASTGALHKDIESLDSIDLSELDPGWGDKATVRMARKSLIGFAEQVMGRLDLLQGLLAAPAAKLKERRREQAARQAVPDEELSLQEKYRDKFMQPAGGVQEQTAKRVALGAPTAGGAGLGGAAPPAKRQRTASPQELEQALRRLRAKVGQPLQRRPLQALRRQLPNLAAIPDLAKNPPLCRDSIECALSAVQAALEEEGADAKAMGKMLNALLEIEALQDPAGLPPVLLDLADVVAAL